MIAAALALTSPVWIVPALFIGLVGVMGYAIYRILDDIWD